MIHVLRLKEADPSSATVRLSAPLPPDIFEQLKSFVKAYEFELIEPDLLKITSPEPNLESIRDLPADLNGWFQEAQRREYKAQTEAWNQRAAYRRRLARQWSLDVEEEAKPSIKNPDAVEPEHWERHT